MKKIQNYENYWKVTLAYTDFNGLKFRKTLQICIDFIDEFHPIIYDEGTTYKELERRIQNAIPKTGKDPDASNRKAINQMVKLGFIKPFLAGYNQSAKDFLNANSDRRRKTIFSKIVYSSARFNSSVTNEDSWSQINFLIDTLEEVGFLSARDIVALMTIDISKIQKGFLNRFEINETLESLDNGFIERKYNQIDHLKNVLGKLDGIKFVKNKGIYELYFTDDAKRIFGEDFESLSKKRNPYLHYIYKKQLKEESLSIFDAENCMVEKLPYPVLIASHIKPFIDCRENLNEAYDPYNGILLSRNIDSLFDLGYITFENDGKIRFANSTKLKQEVKNFIGNYSLDNRFINPKRLEYLEYHRNTVFEKRYKYA